MLYFKALRGIRLYDILANEKDKTSLFRMLYFKSTNNRIPKQEMEQLIKDEWLVADNNYYTWSSKAIQIHSLAVKTIE